MSIGANTQVTFGSLSANAARAFVQNGPGTLVLSATAGTVASGSSFTLNQGTTRFDATNALGTTAVTSLIVNATTAATTALLDLNGFNQSILGLTFGGATATSTSTNTVALNSGTLTLSGNISAAATNHPLTASLTGPGTLNLGGTARTLAVGDSTSTATDLAISADITGTGTSGIIKSGAGTLVLSGTNTYNGATTINQGTVRLGSSSALPSTALTLNANGSGLTALLDLNDFNATITTLTFGGTGSTATSTNAVTTGTGTLTIGGTVTASNTGNPLESTLAGNLNLGTAVRSFNIADSTNAASDLTVSATIANTTGGISKSGTGTLTLSGDNQHSGGTTVTAGTLVLGHNNAAGTGTLTLGGGTLRADAAPLTLANALSLTGATNVGGTTDLTFTNKLTNTANLALTVSNTGTTSLGAIDLSNSGTNRTLTLSTTGGAVAVTGVIANGSTSTASALLKTGAGTLTLSGANTYAGATTIQAGTLSFNSLANVSGGASALGAPTSTANGTLSLGSTTNTATLSYTGSGHSSNRVINLAGTTGGAILDASGTGALVLTSALTTTGTGAKTLTLTGTNTGANTLGGAIVNHNTPNPTSLFKTGPGTWELGGVSTFTGGLTLDAGTLTLKSGASLAATNTLTVDGGTLNLLNAAQTLTSLSGTGGTIHFGSSHTLTLAQLTTTNYAGVFEGGGHLLLNGGGTVTLSGSGASTRTGNTTVNGATLILAKNPGTHAIGGGTLTLSGASSFLRLGASNQIAASTALALAGGTLQLEGFSASLGTLRLDSTSTIDFGSPTASLIFSDSSALTWNGTLNITGYTIGSSTLRFGASASALTSGQLAQINLVGHGLAVIGFDGSVSPIPEPSTYALLAGFGALGLAIWHGHRRSRHQR